ncbi:unnamed protein product [Tenebrio molitor]|nr:unnamed protein product [Tenebrio molitor]
MTSLICVVFPCCAVFYVMFLFVYFLCHFLESAVVELSRFLCFNIVDHHFGNRMCS